MRRAAFLAVLAAASCSPEPRRAFPVGLVAPVSPRVAAEAARLGLEVAARPPEGAALVPAAVSVKGGSGEVAAEHARLRFLAARAIVEGASGIFLRLPRVPAGRDLMDYPEEWQAAGRVVRELLAVRPVLSGGVSAPAPFAVPSGVELRAWAFAGRRYVLLVNAADVPLPLAESSLSPWRALFAVRSDARQDLAFCGKGPCMAPGGVLWLEGRLLPGVPP